jgi:hypothetical protein
MSLREMRPLAELMPLTSAPIKTPRWLSGGSEQMQIIFLQLETDVMFPYAYDTRSNYFTYLYLYLKTVRLITSKNTLQRPFYLEGHNTKRVSQAQFV